LEFRIPDSTLLNTGAMEDDDSTCFLISHTFLVGAPPTITMAAPSKAAVFRAISASRRSCNRFQPGRTVPHEILKDVLETSLVRFACLVDLRHVSVVGSAFNAMSR
jgi:hypothetical protein